MIADIVEWLLLALFIAPAGVFVTEVFLGLWPRRRPPPAAAPARFAVLMPAHDEQPTIGDVARSLAADLPAEGRLLVVADNCRDLTAAVARDAGAEVVERIDPTRRGKGYALAYGRDRLASAAPPDAVVILDADCRFVGGARAAAALAADAAKTGRPVQARNLLVGDLGQPPLVQVSCFAFLVKNRVRQRGLARIGVPAMLGGTGMAIPWPLFATAALATDDLVEDLALGLAFARSGKGARYRDDIAVISPASSEAGTLAQRTRWEHGFLDTARRHGLRLLGFALSRADARLAWTALHLLTPPLALLVILGTALLVVETVLALVGGGILPALVIAFLIALIAVAVLAAWAIEGRGTLSAGALLRIPGYVLWKLPVYLRFAVRRERTWVRTERTPGGTDGPD